MGPGHSCHIYRIWRNKEVGDALKSLFGVTVQATRGVGWGGWGVVFIGKGEFSALLKLNCKSRWVL